MSTESLFHFTEISVSKMTKELSSLNSKKAVTFGNIPTKVQYVRYPLIFVIKCLKKHATPRF